MEVLRMASCVGFSEGMEKHQIDNGRQSKEIMRRCVKRKEKPKMPEERLRMDKRRRIKR